MKLDTNLWINIPDIKAAFKRNIKSTCNINYSGSVVSCASDSATPLALIVKSMYMASQVLLTYYLHGHSLNLLTFSNNAAMETHSSINFCFLFYRIVRKLYLLIAEDLIIYKPFELK